MLYQSLASGTKIPNFPTPPVKQITIQSMPSDLVADGRNFYTEIRFVDYRSAIYGSAGATGLQNVATSIAGVIGSATGQLASDFFATATNIAAIRLPIPTNINDTMTFNWEQQSATSDILGAMNGGNSGNLTRAASQLAGIGGALVGKTLNPFLYAAFNRPNFRSFKFDWTLVPRNKKESDTIRMITQTFKKSSSPSVSAGFFMDYPYIAMVSMYPNNLNGHAIFKPMAVRGISVNLTPNPTPSFFTENEGGGAPTMVNLSVDMMEIKLWHREDITV
jgi:hypothetical protein